MSKNTVKGANAAAGANLRAAANKAQALGVELTEADVAAAIANAPTKPPQGGKVNVSAAKGDDKPNAAAILARGAAMSGSGKGKAATTAKAPAKAEGSTAAKPKGLKAAALANEALIEGYDLDAWGKACPTIPVPTREAIVMATSFHNGGKFVHQAITKNVLAMAFYLMPEARQFDVYAVGIALQAALGGNADHKMNAMQRLMKSGHVTLVKTPVGQGEGQRAKVSYHAVLTAKGRSQSFAALEGRKLKAPKWAQAETAPAKPGKQPARASKATAGAPVAA